MNGSRPCMWMLALLLIAGIVFVIGCSEGPEKPDNLPPEKASNPTPANLSANIQQVGVELQWECSDPEEDSIFYDVYLGTESNPPLMDSNIIENNYCVDFLAGDAVYYWKVGARDSYGNRSTSPIWSFTTGDPFEFIYPLEVGYRWEYRRNYGYYNVDPPDIESEIPIYPEGYSTVEVDSQFQVNGNTIHRLYQYFDSGYETYEQNSYYSNQSDGLMYYDTENEGTGIMDTPAPIRNRKTFIFKGKRYNSLEELFSEAGFGMPGVLTKSVSAYENPLLALSYPLQMGSRWVYRHDESDIFWIDKNVGGAMDVEVPAGLFECYMVQWIYDLDKDGSWDDGTVTIDYICAAGLIKRVVIIKDIIVSTYEHPEGIGTADIMETLELTGYSLQNIE